MSPTLLFVLVACTDQKIDLGALQTPDDIADVCEKYEPEEITLDVLFPAQTGACPWEEGDNQGPADGLLTARVEQVESVELPEDAVICDMAFDFSGLVPDEVQVMVYDDHFFFTFNDIVLSSSFAPAVNDLVADGDLHTWDWSRVVGFDYHAVGDGYDSYCLGETGGSADCDIPVTETPGPITMRYDEELVAELSLSAIADARYDFSFITTGDDDVERDCKHDAFGFTVTVPYLQP
ncbi:MAG: hypothetical protein V4850_01540 [Myxococcota bacterium]